MCRLLPLTFTQMTVVKYLNLNDELASADQFGYNAFAERVVGHILSCAPPKGFAISGPWGAGKTSCLNFIRNKLEDRKAHGKKVHTMWFDAWKYQNEPEPIIALLQQMRKELGGLKGHSKKEILRLMGNAFLDLFTKEIPIKESVSKFRESNYLNQLPTDSVNDLLTKAIAFLVGDFKDKPETKLVIFVDDLDRCHFEGMFKLLEGIKHYLSLANCVLVFGVNMQMLNEGVAKAHQRSDDLFYAREYLEKICHQVLLLPIKNHAERSAFFEKQGKLALGKGHVDLLSGLKNDAAKFEILPSNPRKIKAFVNTLASFIIAHGSRADAISHEDESRRAFLLVTLLYHFYPELYSRLTTHKDFYAKKLLRFAKSGEVGDDAYLQALIQPVKMTILDNDWGYRPEDDIIEEDTFPNAHEAKVFRLQLLIRELKEVDYDEFGKWFIDKQA